MISNAPPSVPRTSQNKVQIGLTSALFGAVFWDEEGVEGGILEVYDFQLLKSLGQPRNILRPGPG